MKDESFRLQGKSCYVAAQASPARRDLFADAGKFTSAFVARSGDVELQTRWEYEGGGLTVLALGHTVKDKDKNSHVQGQTRWIRVGDWVQTSREWRLYEPECVAFGVDPTSLRERMSSTN